MKKVICLLVFMLTLSFSCKKEEQFCWKCTMYSIVNSNKVLSVHDYCDETEQEIIAMEKKWRDMNVRYECEKR